MPESKLYVFVSADDVASSCNGSITDEHPTPTVPTRKTLIRLAIAGKHHGRCGKSIARRGPHKHAAVAASGASEEVRRGSGMGERCHRQVQVLPPPFFPSLFPLNTWIPLDRSARDLGHRTCVVRLINCGR